MSPVQRPKPRPPARPLQQCLGEIKSQWQQQGSLGALWQAWPQLAGPQLAPHCRPLELRGRTLERNWLVHPSRQSAGMATCPSCQSPAPAGELQRWGRCALCLRQDSSVFAPPPGWTGENNPAPEEDSDGLKDRSDGKSARG